eukprot:TRINITY_DN13718_c0_g1_i3.p1 TRINITY_DN13718_c0_g1~~TRINITY_DN13718_c0_g1_i3.p1  ORF type:complete len:404 (-),score=81.37 TRINITY_DN13718_c0_g1_i3:164-1375(-)
MAANSITTILDPYECIAKKNRKYASECTEVHLSNRGAESISDQFFHFGNVEVVWFQGNRLSRIENLESNFRIKEVYIQDNRLVSLAGLKSFKFLQVLLASGNQLRNLDKQLALLSRFAFLKKLDLFDNPVAEEPDYRLRLIYHVPQVQILDQSSVKGPERLRADEVVPNMDSVTATKNEKPAPKAPNSSLLERECLMAARNIKEQRRLKEEALLGQTFSTGIDKATLPPDCHHLKANRNHWSDPRKKVEHEILKPTAWERNDMRAIIEKRANKTELKRSDVEQLAEDLATNGIEEVGRVLRSAKVFDNSTWQDASATNMSSLARSLRIHSSRKGESLEEPHPLQPLLQDAFATMPVRDVTNFFLNLEWPRPHDDFLDSRISKLYEDAQRAEFAGGDSANRAPR